ncbi:MAG: nitroreductase [Saprospiraceae bacterium]|jgi:nitroreductase|uniref:nitroreductase family protein n=1 Tax=Candidatus Brachybacter algidus TaxID=2982024 RepID=UPI001B6FB18A|nr:nitroreductase [Candidatus Brachybacter algidus]MBP7305822.1 nitroreductase [Saprospiraceae bacterium]MBK6372175.1 nitroreductase [Candidatus Brachybacter algidus]MBK6447577.1 nitroreductase [Candidatus Brachybacter algidus]MBK7603414.1 nitroreductase [Candidatus Brachybacter algidus]MBK8356824.1 nitroreductase [Candidatus Brachybacter algidus]
MQSNIDTLRAIIASRKSVFPTVYNDRKIERPVMEAVLESANFAPSHRLTQPWKFVVFENDSLKSLGDKISEIYKANAPADKFSEKKFEEFSKKITKSAAVIAIVLDAHPDLLPEWEEIASTACAVQNMWLTCTVHGLGCYWSSPSMIRHIGPFLSLSENQKCIGLFYMGYTDVSIPTSERTPIGSKVEWRD